MTDRRELILARLAAILDAIPEKREFVRNRGELEYGYLPAIVLLDGREDTSTTAFTRNRSDTLKNITTIRPEIYVLLEDTRPGNLNVGPIINQWRARVFNAIAADAQLRTLLGTNGGLDYLGCETDMQSGRPMKGELRLDFALQYVLDPRELAEES